MNNKTKNTKKIIVQDSEEDSQSDIPELAVKNKKQIVQQKKATKKNVKEPSDQEDTPIVQKKVEKKKENRKISVEDQSLSKDKLKKQIVTNSGPVRKTSTDNKKKINKEQSQEEQSQPHQPIKKTKQQVNKTKKPIKAPQTQSQQLSQEQPKKKVITPTQAKKKIVQKDSQEESEEPPKKVQKNIKGKPTQVLNKGKPKKDQSQQQSQEDVIIENKTKVIPKKVTKKPQQDQQESQEQSQKPINKNVNKSQIKTTQPIKTQPKKPIQQQESSQQEQSQKVVPVRKNSKDAKKKVTKKIQEQEQEQPKVQTRKASKDSLKISGKKIQADQQGQFQVCVQKLSYQAYDSDIRDLFSSCGNILSVRLLTKPDGQSKGTAFVKFGLKSQFNKALEFNGTQHMNRQIVVSEAQKRQNNFQRGNGNGYGNSYGNNSQGNNFQKRDNSYRQNQTNAVIQTPTLFVGNLSFNSTADSMKKFFSQCGQVIGTRIITEKQTGRNKGIGYVDFADVESAKKAYQQLNGSDLDGRNIRLDSAKPRDRPDRPSFGDRGNSRNPGNSTVDLSQDDKNAKSGAIGSFAGKKILLS